MAEGREADGIGVAVSQGGAVTLVIRDVGVRWERHGFSAELVRTAAGGDLYLYREEELVASQAGLTAETVRALLEAGKAVNEGWPKRIAVVQTSERDFGDISYGVPLTECAS
jgi:hypothetical protein